MSWINDSNRPHHSHIGFCASIVGTIIGAAIAAVCMEGKDVQHDPDNAGKPIREWTWKAWDWKDFWSTMIGGLIGQTVQIGIILLILLLI